MWIGLLICFAVLVVVARLGFGFFLACIAVLGGVAFWVACLLLFVVLLVGALMIANLWL